MSATRAIEPKSLEPSPTESEESPEVSAAWLSIVEELPVTLAMEVGRRQITIRELLQLSAGSVIELNRSMGDLFDVLVNGRLLAHGEPVTVNGKCGVRVSAVVQPAERIRRLSR